MYYMLNAKAMGHTGKEIVVHICYENNQIRRLYQTDEDSNHIISQTSNIASTNVYLQS